MTSAGVRVIHNSSPSRGGLITTFVVAALVLFGLTSAALVISAVMLLQQGEVTRRTLQMDYLQRAAELELRRTQTIFNNLNPGADNVSPNIETSPAPKASNQDVKTTPLTSASDVTTFEITTGQPHESALFEYRMVREDSRERRLCEIKVVLKIHQQRILTRRSYLWLTPQ